jgi:hypothetical protein
MFGRNADKGEVEIQEVHDNSKKNQPLNDNEIEKFIES